MYLIAGWVNRHGACRAKDGATSTTAGAQQKYRKVMQPPRTPGAPRLPGEIAATKSRSPNSRWLQPDRESPPLPRASAESYLNKHHFQFRDCTCSGLPEQNGNISKTHAHLLRMPTQSLTRCQVRQNKIRGCAKNCTDGIAKQQND